MYASMKKPILHACCVTVLIPALLGCDAGYGWRYGGTETEELLSVVSMEDSSIVATGYSGYTGSLWQAKMYILKVNADGTELWSRIYKDPELHTQAVGVRLLDDGGYLLTGTSEDYGDLERFFYAARLDGNGDVVWAGTVGDPELRDARCTTSLNTSDGAVLMAGRNRDRFCALKLEQNGAVNWVSQINDISTASALAETSDGGYVAAGERRNWEAYPSEDYPWDIYNLLLVKIDSSGEILWERTFSEEPDVDTEAVAVVELPGGDILVAGHTLREVCYASDVGLPGRTQLLVKTDADGNLIWMKSYGSVCDDTSAYYALALAEDGVLLAGASQNAFLRKIGYDGEVIWERQLEGWNGPFIRAADTMPDGGFVFAGSALPPGFPIWRQDLDASIFRVDSEGKPVK